MKLDVTSIDDIQAAFSKGIEHFGRIDVVYNNAGFSSLAEVEGTPDAVARSLFEVNFWGSANISREAIRVFRDVNKPMGGRIIQASSMAGAQAMPAIGYYSARLVKLILLKFCLSNLFFIASTPLKGSQRLFRRKSTLPGISR